MSFRKTSLVICMILSVLCLAGGYRIAGYWIGAAVAILLAPAWWLAQKYPDASLSPICLFTSIGLAAVGILLGCSPVWMIFGSTVALAVWDFIALDSAVGNRPSAEQTRQYENKHIQSLLLALGFGLFAAALGRSLSIQLPFVVLFALLAFSLFALDLVWGYIKKTG